jgi:hypothetical protein
MILDGLGRAAKEILADHSACNDIDSRQKLTGTIWHFAVRAASGAVGRQKPG